MAALPNIQPTYSSNKTTTPRFLRADFGDGYVQRAADGINTIIDQWNVMWTVDSTTGTTLTTFFEAREGYDDFTWTPPGETESKKFICTQWSKSFLGPDTVQISATFEQVFDN